MNVARTLKKSKGRRESGSFVALPHAVLGSDEWADLSAHAVKLLLDLYGQYKGNNNGDLTAAWSILKARGWRSKDTIYRALDELIAKGWVIKTRQGGRHIPSLYAVSWQAIDECGGKLDVAATNTAPGTWKNKMRGPIAVPHWPDGRANESRAGGLLAR